MSKKTRAQLLAELADLRRMKAAKLAELEAKKNLIAEHKKEIAAVTAELVGLALEHPGFVIDLTDDDGGKP